MRMLALDMSTLTAGMAIVQDDRLLARQTWTQEREARHRVFTAFADCLAAAGTTAGAIDHFVVGLGPGSFAGIRIALSAVNGLALPDGRRAQGLPSPDAIARTVMQTAPAAPVVVVGDARRNRLWVTVYDTDDGWPRARGPVELCPVEAVATKLPAGARVATPDWDRIGPLLEAALPAGALAARQSIHPDAAILASLAIRRLRRGESLAPPTPIYLHPPVQAPPDTHPSKRQPSGP